MGDPAYPTSSAILILPAVDPLNEPLKFDPAEQFDTGLKNRLELGQQQIRIDSAAIAMNVAQNNLLPQLNLVGQVSFQGAGEDLGDAFDAQFEFREPSYSVGFEFEIPFGNRLARAGAEACPVPASPGDRAIRRPDQADRAGREHELA